MMYLFPNSYVVPVEKKTSMREFHFLVVFPEVFVIDMFPFPPGHTSRPYLPFPL